MRDLVVVFDTEASGFASPKKHAANQSWIVELGVLIGNAQGECFAFIDSMIKSEGRSIDPGAQRVHGISTVNADQNGLPESQVAKMLNNLMVEFDDRIVAVAAHNLDFDMPHIDNMMARQGLPNLMHKFPKFCTMKQTTDFCQLPTKRPTRYQKYKWPKLTELHTKLFGNADFKAHSAYEDASATYRCLKTPEVMYIFNSYFA